MPLSWPFNRGIWICYNSIGGYQKLKLDGMHPFMLIVYYCLCISCGLQIGCNVPSIKPSNYSDLFFLHEDCLHIVVNLVEKGDRDPIFQSDVCDFYKWNSWLNFISWITKVYLYQIETWCQNIEKGNQNDLNKCVNLSFHQLLLNYNISFLQVNPQWFKNIWD